MERSEKVRFQGHLNSELGSNQLLVTREPSEARNITEISSSGISLNAELVRGCLDGVVKSMLDSEDELNKLDAEAGDGDCGSTFAGAARAIQASQKAKELDFEQPETLLKQLSVIFEQTVGGTSGALYALMFSSAAQEIHDIVDSNTILEALKKANQAVQKYGGAQVGDRTMVDSLDAMVEELSKGLKENQGLDVFERAVQVGSETKSEHSIFYVRSFGEERRTVDIVIHTDTK